MSTKVELETVYYETVADGVVAVTLNRPDHANGVVPELVRDFVAALDAAEADLGVRALVLTGAGKQFCAGADLHAMLEYIDERMPVEEEPYNSRVLLPLTQRVVTSRLPIVAAVNGGATAGGLDLAMACDIRIASDRAKLGETYVKIGLAPGNGGSWFLPRLVGTGLAAELALTGDVLDADRALEVGLVNRVVPHDELLPAATAFAAKLASRPRRAIEATKQALRSAWSVDLPGAMANAYWTTSSLQGTRDFREGVVSAIEHRSPVYNQRPEAPSDGRDG
jgi:enoyl-CoA hydratase/carnithine racemase